MGDLVMVEVVLVRLVLELLQAEGMKPVVPPLLLAHHHTQLVLG